MFTKTDISLCHVKVKFNSNIGVDRYTKAKSDAYSVRQRCGHWTGIQMSGLFYIGVGVWKCRLGNSYLVMMLHISLLKMNVS